MNALRRLFPFVRSRRRLTHESTARAKRARDHLEKKRDQERSRLSRDRARHEISAGRKRTLRVLTPVVSLVAIALGFLLSTPIAERLWLNDAPLERVAVQGLRALTPTTVAAHAGAIAGTPLDDIDPEQVSKTLMASPWIESARVLRLPTGTLIVRVEERAAIARWQIEDAADWIDEAGGRFAGSDAPDQALPLVRGEADDGTDVLPDDALLILMELTKHASLTEDLAAITLHLPGLVADEDGVLRGSPSGFILEVGYDGPRALLGRRLLPQRVARLASLLNQASETVRTAKLIDLRYADRAVLRTEPTSG